MEATSWPRLQPCSLLPQHSPGYYGKCLSLTSGAAFLNSVYRFCGEGFVWNSFSSLCGGNSGLPQQLNAPK